MKNTKPAASVRKSSKPAAKTSKTVKKAAARAPKKSAASPLLKELASLAGTLDEAHLLALVTQARAISDHQGAASRTPAPSQKTAAPFTKPIEIPRPGDKRTVEVKESDDRSSFIVVINNSRNFFTLPEMRTLVKICHDSAGAQEGSARLHQWFKAKRKDVLIDTDIRGPADPALETIFNYIVKTYAVKR